MDLGSVVFIILALVIVGAVLVLFLPLEREPGAAVATTPPLLRQPYPAGETREQPTPYFAAPVPESPDPLEVAANLDRKALLATLMLLGVFAITGLYYTLETGFPIRFFNAGFPTQMALAAQRQLDTSEERGAELYASLCFDCHGKRGLGDVGVGLPLNKPDFKASCGANGEDTNGKKCKPTDDAKIADLISKTISRGRPFAPPRFSMPAWARSEGGQLNEEQVNQLVNFIMYGDWDRILQIREEQNLSTSPSPPKQPTVATSADLGKQVAQTTCVVCHSFTKGTNSPNPLAPNLGAYATEGPFSDQLKALKASGDPNWLIKWVTDAPSIKPGTGMPKWQGILTDQQISAVVDYLMTLK